MVKTPPTKPKTVITFENLVGVSLEFFSKKLFRLLTALSEIVTKSSFMSMSLDKEEKSYEGKERFSRYPINWLRVSRRVLKSISFSRTSHEEANYESVLDVLVKISLSNWGISNELIASLTVSTIENMFSKLSSNVGVGNISGLGDVTIKFSFLVIFK